MIAACLETAFPVLKNRGNWNNLIGLPLTLLRLTEKERVVILEMGMSVPGEIRELTEIAEPDVGLITNIQKVHLEGMGSLERVKEEIFGVLPLRARHALSGSISQGTSESLFGIEVKKSQEVLERFQPFPMRME